MNYSTEICRFKNVLNIKGNSISYCPITMHCKLSLHLSYKRLQSYHQLMVRYDGSKLKQISISGICHSILSKA